MHYSMEDPAKNSFAKEVSESLRRAAMEVNSLDVARGITSPTKSPLSSSGRQPSPQKQEEFAVTAVPFEGNHYQTLQQSGADVSISHEAYLGGCDSDPDGDSSEYR